MALPSSAIEAVESRFRFLSDKATMTGRNVGGMSGEWTRDSAEKDGEKA